jgi:hypothetical protein
MSKTYCDLPIKMTGRSVRGSSNHSSLQYPLHHPFLMAKLERARAILQVDIIIGLHHPISAHEFLLLWPDKLSLHVSSTKTLAYSETATIWNDFHYHLYDATRARFILSCQHYN